MTAPRIDLYSDTHTLPTQAMRQAMAEAEVGDEQNFEDPTVNKLCAMVAELLGQEAAVFLPSGTMCNQIASRVHYQPGDEIILDYFAHPINAESGGPSALAQAQTRTLHTEHGIFTADQVRGALRARDVEFPAMIDAADAAFLVTAKDHWRAPMGTGIRHQARPAIAVAKGNQVLAQQFDPLGLTIRGQVGARIKWYPVEPEQLPHGRARADPGYSFILFLRKHLCLFPYKSIYNPAASSDESDPNTVCPLSPTGGRACGAGCGHSQSRPCAWPSGCPGSACRPGGIHGRR